MRITKTAPSWAIVMIMIYGAQGSMILNVEVAMTTVNLFKGKGDVVEEVYIDFRLGSIGPLCTILDLTSSRRAAVPGISDKTIKVSDTRQVRFYSIRQHQCHNSTKGVVLMSWTGMQGSTSSTGVGITAIIHQLQYGPTMNPLSMSGTIWID